MAVLNEVFHGFPHLLQVNSWIMPQLDPDLILPNPFQFISYLTISSYLAELLKAS
jgi:hypothetical protein